MSPADEKRLDSYREAAFTGPDHNLYLHVGHFIAWYNMVEWRITILMAAVTGEDDFAAFSLLVRGMDAATKIQRFRKLCAVKKRTIGPKLSERLKFYEDKICKLRDRLAHSPLIAGDDDPKYFHHVAIDRSLDRALGIAKKSQLPPADRLEKISLFEKGYWMNHFTDDLNQVLAEYTPSKTLEITNPSSPLLKAEVSSPAP
jgi:hypothetical protein